MTERKTKLIEINYLLETESFLRN